MARLVKITLTALNDAELANLIAVVESTNPQRAATLRARETWRQERIGPPPIEPDLNGAALTAVRGA
jgi:hypothetical protein